MCKDRSREVVCGYWRLIKGLSTNASYDSGATTNLEWMGYEEFRLRALKRSLQC